MHPNQTMTCALYLSARSPEDSLIPKLRALWQSAMARSWQVRRVFRDRRCRKRRDRAAWQQLCKAIEARNITAVAVMSFDDIGSSARELLEAIEFFSKFRVQLLVLSERAVISGAAGRAGVAVLKAVVRAERRNASERTKMGMAEANSRGRKVGRPRIYLAQSDINDVMCGRRSVASLARAARVSPMTVRRRISGLK